MQRNTMRTTTKLASLALIAALTACSAEKPAGNPAGSGTTEAGGELAAETATAEPTTGSDGPAGEVPANTREPADAAEDAADAAAEQVAQDLPAGLSKKDWGLYWKHIDFLFGSEEGLRAAAESGKPMMIFYTATW
jgi:hypothetical protein